MSMKLFKTFAYFLFMAAESVAIYLNSFLIPVICVFSLFLSK